MKHRTYLLSVGACMMLAACQGELMEREMSDAPAQDDEGPAQDGPLKPAEPMVPIANPDGTLPDVAFSTSVGVRRLTRHEYRRTIEHITGVDLEPSQIPAELTIAGHSQIAGAQKTGYDDTTRYLDLGLLVAEQAAPRLFSESGCDEQDAACVNAWAVSLMRLVFRGAPPEEVRTRYMELLDHEEAGQTPEARRVTWLGALLSSPQFLYRQERGEPLGEPGRRALTSMEIASRMSYLVWQSAPDAELLDVADSQDLRDEDTRRAQFKRLIQHPRAKFGLRAFVEDWMALRDPNMASSKDARILAGTDETLAEGIHTSLELTIDAHFDDPTGGYAGLLATDTFVVDTQIARILELDAVPASRFEPRSLDTSRQLGLLTHPAVIAGHSKESGASPFPIGAFVYNNVLCESIPPPKQVPAFDEESELSGALTLRERLEQLVQGAACVGCHVKINAPGFTFLPFDPIGRYVPADSQGRLHDTSGVMPIGEDQLMFDDISGLAAQLADHPATAECVADRLFRWTYGRFERSGDEREFEALRTIARDTHTDARAMLEALVTSPAFIHVRPSTQENSP